MKGIALLVGIGLAAGLFVPAQVAEAASYDCARARGADEVAVCRTSALSALDSEMGGLWYAYNRVPMLMGENGNRREEEQQFLDRRRACRADVACLTRIYRARIVVLKQGIDAAMGAYSHIVLGTDG